MMLSPYGYINPEKTRKIRSKYVYVLKYVKEIQFKK